MMRRLAAGLAAAALGVTVAGVAASPALADPGADDGHTQLTFDASPEPAWRGKPLTLTGKLSVRCDDDYIDGFVSVHHADYCRDSEAWHRLGRKRIVILFQPARSGRWEYVETVRTSHKGYFHTKVPAYTSGTWRAVFEGDRRLEPAGATDWVKVIGHRR
ncbi:hypothetical protein [Nonomuraea cavernae]|uniref:Uncharacterized protein n=1 Tax=Nonomuraea cavernae TaxID=2045107 RepID=A0A917Z6A6_9ACTN|nr:hypothetical protein [Nonomuraea cavernae]MCA2189139.1 hypothetical protein [Nonomuraea cavernae]GGO76283.1 hypothetical protein GCM10012289_53290 [Nonomuraea cavernae]